MRPIEALAAEVSDVSTVLVSNGALADAFDRHLAIEVNTPEGVIGATEMGRFELVLTIAQDVDAPLTAIDRAIGQSRRQWRTSGTLDVDEVPTHHRSVRSRLRELDLPEVRLSRAESIEGAVCVIDPPSFDALQQRVIPSDAQNLAASEGTSKPPDITVTETRYATTEAVIQTVTDPTATAIVVDGEGPYWPSIRARLDAEGIAHNRSGMHQIGHGFCNLIALAYHPSPVTVDDAKPVLDCLNLRPTENERARPLEQLDDERAIWVRAVTRADATLTLGELLDQFVFRTGIDGSHIEQVLEALDIADAQPSIDILTALEWTFTSSFLDTTDDDEDAVQIIDPTDSSFTERANVIFVNPSEQWLARSQGEAADARERHRLGWLVASGRQQHWLAASRDVERAKSLFGKLHTEPSTIDTKVEPITFDPERRPRTGHDRFTKTQLNNLVHSPRDAMFTRLDNTHASPGLTRGTAIHEYAELRLGAPAALEALGRDRIIEIVLEDVLSLFSPYRRPIEAARINASIAVLDAYLDGVEPDGDGIQGYFAPDWRENVLADRLDVTLISSIAEQYFIDDTLGVSGLVDLILSNTHIVDFKTGVPHPVSELVKRGRVLPAQATIETQLPLYLAALRRRYPEVPLRFTYVYSDGQRSAALAGFPALDVASRTVTYRPQQSQLDLTSVTSLKQLRDSVPPTHPRRVLLDAVEHVQLSEEMDGWRPGDGTGDQPDSLIELVTDSGVDEATARVGVRALLHGLDDRYQHHLYADDIDAFERFIDQWRQRRASFDRNGYPLGDPAEHRLNQPSMHVDLAPVSTREGGR